MTEDGGSGPWSIVRQLVAGATAIPSAILFATLGVAVLMSRALIDTAARGWMTSPPRGTRRGAQSEVKGAQGA